LGSFESQPAGEGSGAPSDGLHRTLNFKACANGAGSLRGQIDIVLHGDEFAGESGEANATRIDYSVWATLTGPLAELPPRQIENALQDLADDFFAEFCAVVEAKHGKRENRAASGTRRQHVFLRPGSFAGLGRKSWEHNAAAVLGGRAAGTLVSPRGAQGVHRAASPQVMPVWGWAAIVVLVAVLLYASHWLG
jgi:hypothetical protein